MIAVLPIVKAATGLVSSLGAGAVVGNAIKATTPPNMKLASKILVGVGGVVISSIAGDLAATYVEGQIQGVVDGVKLGKAQTEAAAHAAAESAAEAARKAKAAAAEAREDFQEGDNSGN